jgi:hypothetical protein
VAERRRFAGERQRCACSVVRFERSRDKTSGRAMISLQARPVSAVLAYDETWDSP